MWFHKFGEILLEISAKVQSEPPICLRPQRPQQIRGRWVYLTGTGLEKLLRDTLTRHPRNKDSIVALVQNQRGPFGIGVSLLSAAAVGLVKFSGGTLTGELSSASINDRALTRASSQLNAGGRAWTAGTSFRCCSRDPEKQDNMSKVRAQTNTCTHEHGRWCGLTTV